MCLVADLLLAVQVSNVRLVAICTALFGVVSEAGKNGGVPAADVAGDFAGEWVFGPDVGCVGHGGAFQLGFVVLVGLVWQ